MATTVTLANLIAGTIEVWNAPYGESLQDFNDIAPSGITTGAPAGNWVQDGSTMDDFNLTYTPTYEDIKINQACADVTPILVDEALEFSFTQAEDDLYHWNRSINAGTLGTTAAGADQTAQDTYVAGSGTIVLKTLQLIGTNPEGGSRIVHIFRAVQTGPSEWARGRSHKGRTVTYKGYADTAKAAGQNLYKIYDITAAASS